MTIHVYTSFSFSYLNRVRVLAESLKRHHPDWVLWAVITDKEPEGYVFKPDLEAFDRILMVEELYGAETDPWLFKHDIVEACTAVKGRALKRIMDEPDAEKVLYFDPDIAIFSSLDNMIEDLNEASIVLTPHQLIPDSEMQAIIDNEVTSLDYGVFNLGFLAVRNDEHARAFANWWAERCDTMCYDRLDIGVFVDQKWCNLIPCFFENVKVSRDPGYNVASWNLSHRQISINTDGMILCNDTPLKFFHFTKLGPIADTMTQRYAQDNLEVYELWTWYRFEVERLTDYSIPTGWWYYGTFRSGKKIPKAVRELYRDRPDLRSAFSDPAGQRFEDWLQKHTKLLPRSAERDQK